MEPKIRTKHLCCLLPMKTRKTMLMIKNSLTPKMLKTRRKQFSKTPIRSSLHRSKRISYLMTAMMKFTIKFPRQSKTKSCSRTIHMKTMNL